MVNDDDLAAQITGWISRNEREGDRLGFKREIDLSTPKNKAEFVRDLMSLANSSEDHDGRDAYPVFGFSAGQLSDMA